MEEQREESLLRINAFLVEKFFPPRCPRCEASFRSWDDLSLYFGEKTVASSLIMAMGEWQKKWPEIWVPLSSSSSGTSRNPYELDFVICNHCKNATLRIMYAKRQVMTYEEAEKLVRDEGFTFISEATASGNMARTYSDLSWLARADLVMLETTVREAHLRAEGIEDEGVAGDIFAATIDKALNLIVKKNMEAAKSEEVEGLLRGIFGTLWEKLEPQSRDFLITAELLKNELGSYAETNPSVDFATVVQSYSKALERTLLQKVFIRFADSPYAAQLPSETGRKTLDNSVLALQKLVSGQHDITLGSMAFCLLNVGCKMKHYDSNGFAQFLQSVIGDLDKFCDFHKFPARLNAYVNNYRNRAAHVSKITKEECMSARAFLLEEPVKLLVLLEQLFSSAENM